jgi:hypothetical protein
MAAAVAPKAPAPITPAAAPSHLVRCETVDIVLAHDRGLRLAAPGSKSLPLRNRRQRRSLRARGQHGPARDKSKGEFQKVAAFHDIPPLRIILCTS